jgi:hypothetical protein
MKRYLLSLIILLASGIDGQHQPIRIGEIEFFGYAKVDLDKVRAALPVREGDPVSRETSMEKIERDQQAMQRAIGHAPTDI